VGGGKRGGGGGGGGKGGGGGGGGGRAEVRATFRIEVPTAWLCGGTP
jgi:hypothetical protein